MEEQELLEKQIRQRGGTPPALTRPSLGRVSVPSTALDQKSVDQIESSVDDRLRAIEDLNSTAAELKKEVSKAKVAAASSSLDALVGAAQTVDGIRLVTSRIEASDLDDLKRIGDSLRARLGSGVGVLGTVIENKATLLCVVTADLLKSTKLQAGKIVVKRRSSGGGGGRPYLACRRQGSVAVDEASRCRISEAIEKRKSEAGASRWRNRLAIRGNHERATKPGLVHRTALKRNAMLHLLTILARQAFIQMNCASAETSARSRTMQRRDHQGRMRSSGR
jgi:cell division septum initiation protein DivIVA